MKGIPSGIAVPVGTSIITVPVASPLAVTAVEVKPTVPEVIVVVTYFGGQVNTLVGHPEGSKTGTKSVKKQFGTLAATEGTAKISPEAFL